MQSVRLDTHPHQVAAGAVDERHVVAALGRRACLDGLERAMTNTRELRRNAQPAPNLSPCCRRQVDIEIDLAVMGSRPTLAKALHWLVAYDQSRAAQRQRSSGFEPQI